MNTILALRGNSHIQKIYTFCDKYNSNRILAGESLIALGLWFLRANTSYKRTFTLLAGVQSTWTIIVCATRIFRYENIPKPLLTKFLGKEINFSLIKQFAFTEAKKSEYEAEIERGGNSEFLKLIKSIAEADQKNIQQFEVANFFPWFLEQLELMLEKGEVEEDLRQKLYENLAKNNLFGDETSTIEFQGKDGAKIQVQKVALLLLSTYFKSVTIYKNKNQVQADYSQPVLDAFRQHVYSNRCVSKNFADLLTLYDFSRMVQMVAMQEQYANGLIECHEANSIKTVENLESFLNTLNSNRNTFEDNVLYCIVMYRAIAVFYQNAYNDPTAQFYDSDKTFAIPFNALYLLTEQGTVQNYLRKTVKAIHLTTPLDQAAIDQLRFVTAQMSQEAKEKFTTLKLVSPNASWSDSISKIRGFLPKINTIHFEVPIDKEGVQRICLADCRNVEGEEGIENIAIDCAAETEKSHIVLRGGFLKRDPYSRNTPHNEIILFNLDDCDKLYLEWVGDSNDLMSRYEEEVEIIDLGHGSGYNPAEH
ncbi:MAG: hypothetical protein ChlgKO_08630 [Chlamydiales bacterium]